MIDLLDCKVLIILDVENTAWEGSCARGWSEPWEEKEIIQIAMLALDAQNLDPISDFSCLVRPVINPMLSDYIMDLTGISQHEIDAEGLSLKDAFNSTSEFLCRFDPDFKIVCNGIDGGVLSDNAALLQISCPVFFKECVSIHSHLKQNIPTYSTGHFSGDLADVVNRPLTGQKHNALHDVQSIREALKYIQNKLSD